MKNLLDVLCVFNNCHINDLALTIRNNYKANIDFIRTLVLRTKHLKNNDVIKPDFVTNRPACQLFALRGYKGIDVDQYFFLKHNCDLMFPNLPCLAIKGGRIKGGGIHKTYYPMEVVEVLDIKDLKIN
jgi:hypothetical protein